MVTYVVLANFTDQGIRSAKDSPKRAEAFKQMAKTFGVTVKEIFWTQGRYDVVTVLDAPDELGRVHLGCVFHGFDDFFFGVFAGESGDLFKFFALGFHQGLGLGLLGLKQFHFRLVLFGGRF